MHEPISAPAMGENSEFTTRLAAHRAEIDAMDDELIALIMRRCEVVQQVGLLKTEHLASRCFIRPAREAQMVKRIAAAFGEHSFSAGAAAAIWRLIIAASTSIEQPLRIAAYFQPERQEAYWLAREYFGIFSQLSKEATPSRVIGQLMDESALVGILPPLDGGQEENWWKLLHDADARQRPAIFACLPYASLEMPGTDIPPRPQALAVGYVDCEPTGEDVSYLVIEGKHDLSQSRIHGVLAAAQQPARWLQVAQAHIPDHRLHLVELEGYHTQDGPLLQTLREQCQEQLHRVTLLGTHAKPILLPN